MKTSTYITSAFFVFVFITALLLPMDSKLHEQEHISLLKKRSVLSDIQMKIFNNTITKEEFSSYSSKFESLKLIESGFMGNDLEFFIHLQTLRFKDTTILKLLKKWYEIDLKHETFSIRKSTRYADVLYYLGHKEEAVNLLENAISNLNSSNYNIKYRNKNGEFKVPENYRDSISLVNSKNYALSRLRYIKEDS